MVQFYYEKSGWLYTFIALFGKIKKRIYIWKETKQSTRARQWKWCFCSRTVQYFRPAAPEHQPRAALLFAGCAKENITPTETPDNNSQKGDITLSFSASQTGFGTKAVIGETTGEGISKSTAINWQSTDQISVFDGANENCQFSTKGFNADAPSCTFEGNVTKLAIDYIAVYPYTESATISDGVISGISLPATQTAVAGSFDPKAALMAAKTVSGERELAFKNLVGYVRVATDFECKKIELCSSSWF